MPSGHFVILHPLMITSLRQALVLALAAGLKGFPTDKKGDPSGKGLQHS